MMTSNLPTLEKPKIANKPKNFWAKHCHDLKEDLMGTKFFIIFVKYVVYDWG